MSRRLGRPAAKTQGATTKQAFSQSGATPNVYLCACNHGIDLGAGFERCPKCGAPIQPTLPLS
jgi:hypothetical protein